VGVSPIGSGARLRKIFRRYDPDRSGTVSDAEFRHGLASQRLGLSAAEVARLAQLVDFARDGVISYDAFIALAARAAEGARRESFAPPSPRRAASGSSAGSPALRPRSPRAVSPSLPPWGTEDAATLAPSEHTTPSPSKAHVRPRAGWLADPNARANLRHPCAPQPLRGPSEPPWGISNTPAPVPCTPTRSRAGSFARRAASCQPAAGPVRVLHPAFAPPPAAPPAS
jgi:hypothetical protein